MLILVDVMLVDVVVDLVLFELLFSVSCCVVLGSCLVCWVCIIEGMLDGCVIVVDVDSGCFCVNFGNNGQVDIILGMGEVLLGYVLIILLLVIVCGVIVIGYQVLDGQCCDVLLGVIQVYDVIIGKLCWVWDMDQFECSGLLLYGQIYMCGMLNMWIMVIGDEVLGLVYLLLGNFVGDYWSGLCIESQNWYLILLVVFDVVIGKLVWYFQVVCKDVWDYDLGLQVSLIDYLMVVGKVLVILLLIKQGDFYIFDCCIGQLLIVVEECKVLVGGVEFEQCLFIQLFLLYYILCCEYDLIEFDMWGIILIDQLVCCIQFCKVYYEGFYMLFSSECYFIEYFGYNGGLDWGSVFIDM